jgi:amidase
VIETPPTDGEASASLAAAAAWEPTLHAFAWLDPDDIRARAHVRPRGGPLDGVPVAVKDIFDTAGTPTEYGSPLFAGRVPARSAEAVRRIEAAGAVILGKTVTAELAYYSPGPTTNPWLSTHTPGGSSMGSAAAVAARIAPLALGTQTNGSVIRPAAFCGVVGLKPTSGRLPREGVLSFSPSLDQVGLFADTVARGAQACAILAGESRELWWSGAATQPPKVGITRPPEWDECTPAMRAAFDTAIERLAGSGATAVDLPMPPTLSDSIGLHQTIMAVEAARNIAPLVAPHEDRCSAQLRALLVRGRSTTPRAYEAALESQAELRHTFARWIENVDAVLTLAALGEAPELDTTGDPRCCTRWTLIGAPAIALPCGLGAKGLPLAVQLVGPRQADLQLTSVAAWVQARLPSIGHPPAPND